MRLVLAVMVVTLAVSTYAGAAAAWHLALEGATPSFASGGSTVTRNLQAASTTDANFMDSSISSGATSTNNGTLTTMDVSASKKSPCNTGNICERAVVWFDMSDIAVNSTVSAASLTLVATAGSTSATHELHKITNSWTETGVTWNSRNGTTNWTAAGGDFNGTNTTTLATGTTTGAKTFGDIAALRSDVLGWINNSGTNFGWLIQDQTETGAPAAYTWSYATKEDATAANRPKLTVTFTAPWDSYTTSTRNVNSENFSGSPKTVYMRGTGYTTGNQYRVAYYDGGGTKRFEEGPLSVSGGNLDSAVTTSNYPTATQGLWHAVVQQSTGTAFPATYSSINADTQQVIGDDTFTVAANALPEFPSVSAAAAAGLLAVAAYVLLRRRLASQPAFG